MVKERFFALVTSSLVAACNVSNAPASTGGVDLDGGGDGGGARCPAGLVVASSDFTSTNISVLSPTGTILSGSIISSASAAPGITAALSGDVVLPTEPTVGRIVLIDRFPNSVLTWLDPATAAVIHQLPVGTGFAANPHDYLELSATKAYVSRYESNMAPGKEPNDGGGDLLVVNPKDATIDGRIPFVPEGMLLPRPDRMIRVGGEVWVSLHEFDADFKTAGDARLVGLSTADDSIAWTIDLPDVASCGGMALSPSGKVLALACSGVFGDMPATQRSAVVLLDATARPPVELKRFAVASMLGAPLGSTVAFADETRLLGVTLGDAQTTRSDLAYVLDASSGTATMLADAAAPFVFGDVRCSPGCSNLCMLADAKQNVLRVFDASSLEPKASLPVDSTVGLPPRAIGAL
jgi:hypothetical protein